MSRSLESGSNGSRVIENLNYGEFGTIRDFLKEAQKKSTLFSSIKKHTIFF